MRPEFLTPNPHTDSKVGCLSCHGRRGRLECMAQPCMHLCDLAQDHTHCIVLQHHILVSSISTCHQSVASLLVSIQQSLELRLPAMPPQSCRITPQQAWGTAMDTPVLPKPS